MSVRIFNKRGANYFAALVNGECPVIHVYQRAWRATTYWGAIQNLRDLEPKGVSDISSIERRAIVVRRMPANKHVSLDQRLPREKLNQGLSLFGLLNRRAMNDADARPREKKS